MIQRVQTLFLLATSILLIVFLFLPIWKKEANPANDSLTTLAVKDKVVLSAFHVTFIRNETNPQHTFIENIIASESTWYIGTLAIIAAAIALFSIFQYRNRMFQIKLGLLNSLFIAGVLGLIFLGINRGNELMPETSGIEDFQFGFYIPAIALLCNTIASRFIRKDEELVRSADRIR